MAVDDDTPARVVPRFVPTLTEVVTPGAALAPPLPEAEPPPSLPPAAPAALPLSTAEQSADALLARLGPELDRLIAEAIGRVVHEQMLGFSGRVHHAVADVVREAVARAAAQDGRGAGLHENP